MTTWLDPVRTALDRASSPIQCFFRDDDGGWADDRLLALLDLFQTHSMAIDLALIPAALSDRLARTLVKRIELGQQPLGFHQHGYQHVNHQSTGRKCEFGDQRLFRQQYEDIARGRQILFEALGDHSQAIFTPPWNRCTQDTVRALSQLGFQALSRDNTGDFLATEDLVEIPVSIDWFGKKQGLRFSFERLGLRIATQMEKTPTLGIMLHHQHMDATELSRLGELLRLFSHHPALQPCLMKDRMV